MILRPKHLFRKLCFHLNDGKTREEADSFWPYLSEESLAMYQELAANELAGKQ